MHALGTIRNIWRYPLKSSAPQTLGEARLEENGIPGDREAALFVESGHAREGKTYRGKEHNLLHTASAPEQAAAFAAQRGVAVTVRKDAAARFFDDAPVSLIFDRWIAEVAQALGKDLEPLRWRPNLYAIAEREFAYSEGDLIGCCIEAGTAVLRVKSAIGRCVVPNYDLSTGEADAAVLRYVANARENRMGVYCEVELAGIVREGDALRLRAR
jgi:uncharacterized protein YcbX